MNRFKIGAYVKSFAPGLICSTYPLEEFPNYNNQIRNNNITEGYIIGEHEMHRRAYETILIENCNEVIAVRAQVERMLIRESEDIDYDPAYCF